MNKKYKAALTAKTMRCFAALTLAFAACLGLLSGCAAGASSSAQGAAGTQTGQDITQDKGVAQNVSFSTAQDDDYFDWKAQRYTTIDLSQGSASITKSGIYELTGTLTDGSVTVNVDKNADEGTVFLVLNGASLHSENGTPLSIAEAKKVTILLETGTESTVTQGAVTTTDTEFPSAAIFSKADMTITGSGSLTVTTQYNDGITSKDDLLVTGGTLNVTAPGDGLVGKDLLAVETADITIDAGKDGMRATNATEEGKGNLVIAGGTFAITAGNDGVQAEKTLQIDGGTFALQTGGGYAGSIKTADAMGGFGSGMGRRATLPDGTAPTDAPQGGTPPALPDGMNAADAPQNAAQVAPPNPTSDTASVDAQAGATQAAEDTNEPEAETAESDSKKGLKAGTDLVVNGGTFTLSAYEDAVHANGSVTITDGVFTIQAGDDAVHADATVTVSGGTLDIKNSFEGIEGANVTLAGGTVRIVSDDDGVNVNDAAGVLTVSGGEISVSAGGDGLDSNGNLVISGGTLTIDTSTVSAGNSPLDYDGAYTGTGGTVTDQNGDAIDPSVRTGPGGGKGGGMRGANVQASAASNTTQAA